MSATEEIVNGSIVIVGAFAPAMFTPDWLVRNNLIGETDREEMMKEGSALSSSTGTKLDSETLSFIVTPTRFQLISKDVLRPIIKDVAVNVLQLLGRVQVAMVGLNFMSHFAMGSEDEYHLVGDSLAPKQIWTSVFPNRNWSVGLTDLAVKIHPAPRGDNTEIHDGITVRVQPSAQVNRGVLLTYNNHKQIDDADPKVFSDEVAIDFITQHWDASFTDSKRAFKELLSLCTQEERYRAR